MAALVVAFNTTLAQNQYEIPIYVTASSPSDTTVHTAIAANPGVDFVYQKADTAYRYGFGGFNNLIVDNEVFPIHLEDFDDFNAAVFKSDSTLSILYSGAQGAIKNDFLFQRNKAFKEYGMQKGLLQQPFEELSQSLDSMISVWNQELDSYPFTARFVQDEQMFYESYRNFAKMSHQLIAQNKTDLSQAALADFPVMDYNNKRYYTTISMYRELAKAYHFKKLLEYESARKGKRYINRLDGFYLGYDLRIMAFALSTEHHPKADFLYDVSKPKYNPHDRYERRRHRFSSRTGAGTTFEHPISYTLGDEPADFTKLRGKKIYFLVYNLNDPKLGSNLQKWNLLYSERIKENAYFVSWATNGQVNPELWKRLQINTQIAGWSLTSSMKDANEYLEDLGMVLTPRVIVVDEKGIVTDPNLDVGFHKTELPRYRY